MSGLVTSKKFIILLSKIYLPTAYRLEGAFFIEGFSIISRTEKKDLFRSFFTLTMPNLFRSPFLALSKRIDEVKSLSNFFFIKAKLFNLFDPSINISGSIIAKGSFPMFDFADKIACPNPFASPCRTLEIFSLKLEIDFISFKRDLLTLFSNVASNSKLVSK